MTLRTVRQSVAQGSGVTCNVPGEYGTGVGVDCADAEAWHGARAAGAVRVVQPTEVTVHLDHRVRDGSPTFDVSLGVYPVLKTASQSPVGGEVHVGAVCLSSGQGLSAWFGQGL